MKKSSSVVFLLLVAKTVNKHVFPMNNRRREKNKYLFEKLTDRTISYTKNFNCCFRWFNTRWWTSKAHRLIWPLSFCFIKEKWFIMLHTRSESCKYNEQRYCSCPVCSSFSFLFFSLLFYALGSVVECKKCVTGTVCCFYENQTYTTKFASIHVTIKVKCKRKRMK